MSPRKSLFLLGFLHFLEKGGDMDFQLLSVKQLLALPPPEWLIEGFIEKKSLAALYGQSGTGKSFIALDWSLCVATGKPWLGTIPVEQNPVIYIAAEGGRSIQKRVMAWMKHYNQRDLDAAQFAIKPLYVRDPDEITILFDVMDEQDVTPGLLVIDTLSQSFGPGDENSMDMQEFVGAVTELRNDRQMAILIVHHTNAMGARERGHSSFRAGMDHMFETTAKKDDDYRLQEVTLLNNKQKDTESQPRLFFLPHSVKDSLVMVPGVLEEPAGPKLARTGVFQGVMADPLLMSDRDRARALETLTGQKFEACRKRIQRFRAAEDKKRGTE